MVRKARSEEREVVRKEWQLDLKQKEQAGHRA